MCEKYLNMEEETTLQKEKAPHHGENIKRFRLLRGFKQGIFAAMMGFSVKWLGELEKRAVIDDKTLQKIADQLQVHIDILKNYTDDCEVQINVSGEHVNRSGYLPYYTENNDVDKFMELIKPLYEEINAKNLENYKLKEEIKGLKKKA